AEHPRRLVGDRAHGWPQPPDRAPPVPEHGTAPPRQGPRDRARLLREPRRALRRDLARRLIRDRRALPQPRGPRRPGSVRLPGRGAVRPLIRARRNRATHSSPWLLASITFEACLPPSPVSPTASSTSSATTPSP